MTKKKLVACIVLLVLLMSGVSVGIETTHVGDLPDYSASVNSAWKIVCDNGTNTGLCSLASVLGLGVGGSASYMYVAYASDTSGTGFSLTPSASLDYVAFKSTVTAIPSPVASDFTGLWKQYKGDTGTAGAAGDGITEGSDGEWGLWWDAQNTENPATYCTSHPYGILPYNDSIYACKNGSLSEVGAGGGTAVDDTAYNATSWDNDTTHAPSKNAVRDKVETLQPLDADLTSIAALSCSADQIPKIAEGVWTCAADSVGSGSFAILNTVLTTGATLTADGMHNYIATAAAAHTLPAASSASSIPSFLANHSTGTLYIAPADGSTSINCNGTNYGAGHSVTVASGQSAILGTSSTQWYMRSTGTCADGGGSDVTPPTLSSSTVATNGTGLTLAWAEAAYQGSGWSNGHINVDCPSHTDIPVTYSAGNGTNSWTLALGNMVLQGDSTSCNIDFTGTANSIEDAAGNDVAAITSAAVTNNSTQGGESGCSGVFGSEAQLDAANIGGGGMCFVTRIDTGGCASGSMSEIHPRGNYISGQDSGYYYTVVAYADNAGEPGALIGSQAASDVGAIDATWHAVTGLSWPISSRYVWIGGCTQFVGAYFQATSETGGTTRYYMTGAYPTIPSTWNTSADYHNTYTMSIHAVFP